MQQALYVISFPCFAFRLLYESFRFSYQSECLAHPDFLQFREASLAFSQKYQQYNRFELFLP